MPPPPAPGLYDPRFEHAACGLAALVRLDGRPAHELVWQALRALENLDHRGATGADPDTGDGAGIMTQLPHRFLRAAFREALGHELPPPGSYATGLVFLPRDPSSRLRCEELCVRICAEEGQRALGWRDPPVHPDRIGRLARASEPVVRQLFVERRDGRPGGLRAQALRDPPPGRAGGRLGRRARGRVHDREPVVAAARVQGSAARAAARRLLRRPARPPLRERARPRPQPLLHEHLRHLGPRAPVQPARPQRRDQHGAGQRQLAGRARAAAALAAPRRRSAEALSDRRRALVGLGQAGRRGRAARARRALAGARADHARAAGVDRSGGGGRRCGAGLLRVHELPGRAVGRPGGGDRERRRAGRRPARPKRPAPGPLRAQPRRPGRRRVRGGGGGHRPRRRRRARAHRPGPGARPGHRASSRRRRPRAQAGPRPAAPVRGVARRAPRMARPGRRRPARARAGARRGGAHGRVRLYRGGARADRAAARPGRGGAGGLDGRRCVARRALGAPAAPAELLPAAVRAGHEPCHRPPARGARHEPAHVDRGDRQPARRAARALPARRRAPAGAQPRRARAAARHRPRRVRRGDALDALPGRRRPHWDGAGDRRRLPGGVAGRVGRGVDRGALRPRSRRGPRRRAAAARGGGCALAPRPRGRPHDVRAGRRVRRASRDDAFRAPARLRRRRRHPLPGARGPAGGRPRALPGRRVRRPAQGVLQDGDRDRAELPRCPDLRGRRPRRRPGRSLLPGDRLAARRDRPAGAPRRDRRPARPRLRRPRRERRPRGRRRVPLPRRRRAPRVGARADRAAATGRPRLERGGISRLRPRGRRTRRPARDAARPARADRRRPSDRARRRRAGDDDRAPVRHRGDEPGLDLAGGARDACDRDEPARGPLQHGRGRRGPGPVDPRRSTATCAGRPSSRWPRAASG